MVSVNWETFPAPRPTAQGQTIAIVNAFDDATILADANTFAGKFGLPALTASNFQVANLYGGPNPSPPGDDWTVETSLDVEWAHAMAPGANILLVEAASDGLGDLMTAAAYAANMPGVSAVSMSWG